MRMLPIRTRGLKPMAERTPSDFDLEEAEHALEADKQKPLSSITRRKASLGTPGRDTVRICGRKVELDFGVRALVSVGICRGV